MVLALTDHKKEKTLIHGSVPFFGLQLECSSLLLSVEVGRECDMEVKQGAV
jgi:hypothetical protein